MTRLRYRAVALAVTLVTASCGSETPTTTTSDTTAGTVTVTTEVAGFQGAWLGDLLPGVRIQLRLERNEAGRLTGVLDSIDEGVMGIPIDKIVESGDRLDIWVGGLESSGEFTLDDDRLTGTISIDADDLDVTLARQDEPFAFDRPQEPDEPYPYLAEEVVFANDEAGFELAGTLTIPAGDGPFPAVVLISGSGPQDRDEQLAGHRPFLVLADHLTRAGIAVLRYDDRGYGESGGSLEGTSEDLATDAAAAFTYLSSRPETGITGLIGHSEGGLIAPMVANTDSSVSFIVMLAGPGETGAEVLLAQTALIMEAEGVPSDITDWQIALTAEVIAASVSEIDELALREDLVRISSDAVDTAPTALAGLISLDDLVAGLEPYADPWMRFFLRYDPEPVLRALTTPVLALFGEVDVQVPAGPNAAAVDAAIGGVHPSSRVEIIPGVNHLFQHSTTGKISEYSTLTETIAPEVLDLVTAWVLEVAAG